jgi:hypothetical protein
MLDVKQPIKRQFPFFKYTKRTEEDDGTQETQRVASIRKENTTGLLEESSTEQPVEMSPVIEDTRWLTEGPSKPPEQTMPSQEEEIELEKLDPLPDILPERSPSALEELKKLADLAVQRTEERHKAMQQLEELASGKHPIPGEQETQYVPCIPKSKSSSGSTRIPTKYKNPSLSPYMLIIAAIIENRRYLGKEIIPSGVYASDTLIQQLYKDMKHCLNRDFNGKSIPFTLLDGNIIDIPVISAKSMLGVDLPIDMVWCSNCIE